jgi:CubicO group peptidase (beta-lactamase class C family)
MRLFTTLILCLLSLTGMACAGPMHGQSTSHTPPLLQGFLDALNSKDKDKIVAFIKSNCADKLLAKADRMASFSQMGAPFSLVQVTDDGKGNLSGTLKDTNSTSISFNMTLGDNRIQGVMLKVGEGGPTKDYSGWSDLNALTENLRADATAPGMAVAVMHDGKVEVATSGVREIGKSDLVKRDDPFSIGSIGKSLCSTVIGKLIEDGKLRWDETLSEALPGVPMKDGYKTVTLEEILHHRGGIPEDPGMRKVQVERIVGALTDRVKIRDSYSRDILSRDPIGKPNEKFAYSNAGYELLGHIAETAAGKPYEALVKEMIFQPLGMTHSYTGMDTLPADRPSGHVSPDGPDGGPGGGGSAPAQAGLKWQPMNFEGPMEIMFAPAGGGMFCSAEDLTKFGVMHLNGLNGKDGLLKASTIQRLHSGIPEDLEAAVPTDIKASYTADPGSRLYACGWGIESHPGIEVMHTHNGSNGTMRAQLAIFPKSGVVVVAFVNCGGESEPSPPLQACIAIAQRYAKQ